jgi:hypothetical protein
MEFVMMDNLQMTKSRDSVSTIGMTAESTMGTGIKESNMELEHTLTEIKVQLNMDFGSLASG